MRRRAARHAERMEELHRQGWTGIPEPWYRRQAERQQPVLEARRQVQKDVLALLMHARGCGKTTRHVARALGIAMRTLLQWQRSWDDLADRLRPAVRGAPQYVATPAQRHEVHRIIDLFTPWMPEAALQELFPEIARREVMRLLMGRRAAAWRDGQRRGDCQVRWSTPGQVWAMDFTELDEPDAQGHRYALVVRDLASRCIIATEACDQQEAAVVLRVVTRLLRTTDPPLVIKADNGRHFRCAEVEALLVQHGIVPLWSPPYCPRFNGAIEAGIGRWKDRLRILVDRDGQGQGANGDHLEGARLWANRDGEATRGVSPEQSWQVRPQVGGATRSHFQQVLRWERARALEAVSQHQDIIQSTVASCQTGGITLADAAHRRAAIAALVATGAVHIRRRSIAQPIMEIRSA